MTCHFLKLLYSIFSAPSEPTKRLISPGAISSFKFFIHCFWVHQFSFPPPAYFPLILYISTCSFHKFSLCDLTNLPVYSLMLSERFLIIFSASELFISRCLRQSQGNYFILCRKCNSWVLIDYKTLVIKMF